MCLCVRGELGKATLKQLGGSLKAGQSLFRAEKDSASGVMNALEHTGCVCLVTVCREQSTAQHHSRACHVGAQRPTEHCID